MLLYPLNNLSPLSIRPSLDAYGRVVELRQLLKLLQESKGRFIRLGEEDWLALDNQLRQRLQQIALLAGDNEHLTLNALTLPFLKSLAGESGEFDGDADWHRQLRGLTRGRNIGLRYPLR